MRVELPQPGDRELAVVVPGAAADQSCESDGGSVERGCEIPGPGGSLVVDDDHRRTGYGQQVDQRRDLESRVDRGVDGAELGRGREERDEIEVRRPDDRDAPTEADAEIARSPCPSRFDDRSISPKVSDRSPSDTATRLGAGWAAPPNTSPISSSVCAEPGVRPDMR